MQLPLFDSDDSIAEAKHTKPTSESNGLMTASFSYGEICSEAARIDLEQRYAHLLEETDRFDRQLVSYQGNKRAILHSWIKYREGFSAQLVETLIGDFGIQPGDRLIEPFSGSGTTLLTAKSLGIDAVGAEILPVCRLAWEAKSHVFDYDLEELDQTIDLLSRTPPQAAERRFPHLVITESAFPEQTENDLMFYTEFIEGLTVSSPIKLLMRLAITSILEDVSYTRKDGQYLRWDARSEKLTKRNQDRSNKGKNPIRGMTKGSLPSVREALIPVLRTIAQDIRELQKRPLAESHQQLINGNVLTLLPELEADQFDGVITSPPYCNRYDYTRTYALELAYLGIGEEGIRALRQSQLSCTVENRSKVNFLREFYAERHLSERFNQILATVQNNSVFKEINSALQTRWERGEINNQGILPMVEGYFTELTFVFAEILRVCKAGAHAAFINDNVRYGGEIIPVDLLTTDLAATLGFEPITVYVLPQRKGNSSQQMGRFGREPLRKSITVWKVPD